MTLQWIAPLAALSIYAALVLFSAFRRDWRDVPTRRLVLYLLTAILAQSALFASSVGDPASSVRPALLQSYLIAHSALPLFFYAFARAFIRIDQKPWAFFVGLTLLIAAIVADLFQATLYLTIGQVSTGAVVFLLRTSLWAFVFAFIVVIGAVEYSRTTSPLHRNRLSYLAIALPFLLAYDALDLMTVELAVPFAPILEIIGVAILSYATLRHNLLDLRDLLRRSARNILVAIFAILVYTFAIEAALALLRGSDPTNTLAGSILAAVGLALLYQPLRDWVQRLIERLLFGRNYDVREVVRSFSQQLAAEIELDDLAVKGRMLLAEAMGARDAALLLVNKNEMGYTLDAIPAPAENGTTVRLDATSSVARALSARSAPLLQYDIDRLAQYADLSRDARDALQKLRGEVFVPIRSRGALIGVWVIGARRSGDRYSSEDLSLLTTLAGQSAVALENARLLADLREQMLRVGSMRDYLDSTLASIATGVVTVDQDGRITSFNRAAEGIFVLPSIKALGRPYADVLPPIEGVQLHLLIARLWARSAQHLVRDVVAHVPDRGEVHLTLHMSGIWSAQEMVGVAIVVEDLTEQARLEVERRAQEQETLRVRATFEHYVAPAVVEGLLADSRRISLGGERQLLTILFADIHGFTKLSESLPPEQLVDVLNGYLSLAYQSVLRYEGTLDKFLGDGVMAIFNAPLPQSDHAWRAARAALALQRQVAAYAPKLPPEQRLTFRIGLHTGEAIVGNIGTHELMNYTAVGDSVNIAKRLQEGAESGQILLSRSAHALIESKVVVRPREKMMVRGREQAVEVFELLSAWEEG